MIQELEIATMSEKGQVVIPQVFRKKMGLKARTKFVVMRRGNFIVMRTLALSEAREELENIFRKMDEKNLKISDGEIEAEIKEHRRASGKSSAEVA